MPQYGSPRIYDEQATSTDSRSALPHKPQSNEAISGTPSYRADFSRKGNKAGGSGHADAAMQNSEKPDMLTDPYLSGASMTSSVFSVNFVRKGSSNASIWLQGKPYNRRRSAGTNLAQPS